MTLLFQEAAHAATEAGGHAAFHPVAPWLILLLPLVGFVVNGLMSVLAARRALPVLPPVGDPHWDAHHESSEQEGHDHGTRPSPVDAAAADHAHGGHDDAHDAHDHPAGPKPWTHTLPSLVAPGVLLAAFALAVVNWLAMRDFMHGAGEHPAFEPSVAFNWMPVGELQVWAALLLDPLSMLMTLIITGVGSLIHIFSIGYMKEDPGYPRFMAYLNLFVFFMLVLVLGASYPLMFVGWEGVGLCSYLLIGFWFKERANADAGKKAFIVNRIGDFGFLIAMFLIFANLGTLDFASHAGSGMRSVFEAAPGALPYAGAVVTAICLFLFLGAAGKSAQIPLYVWLPDAMAGPTPVSALIHAATMVTAGVYLVVRSSVLFTLAPAASLVVALVGALTAIFAATIGLKQWDIKKVLAYSTVSQLGFMFAAVGMGAYVAGVFHLMTHAFFKACLFLGSGAVIHAMHHALHATHNPADAQDMRNMGGLRKYLPVTFATMGIATLAIAGVPPFAGFFSKDEIIGAAWLGAEGHSAFSRASLFGIPGTWWMGFIGGTLSLAAFMTAFYMGRMMIYTFFGDNRTGETERRHLHEGNWTLTLPLVVLAALSTVGGFLNVEDVPIVRWFDFGQGAALHHWLHPVIAGSEDVIRSQFGEAPEAAHHAWPIILAIVIGLGGLALAWMMLARRRLRTADQEPAYTSAPERVLYNKYYIDELYDSLVVRPVGALSRMYAAFDRYFIDGLVDFFGRLAQGLGMLAGRAQTGLLNTYAFVIIVGVLVVLGSFVAL
ncbi:MAG: NADH-quinone oxidoreductase subunit L [Gemmatimonadota bacterium]